VRTFRGDPWVAELRSAELFAVSRPNPSAELCQRVGPDHERMTSRVGAGREHVPGPHPLCL